MSKFSLTITAAVIVASLSPAQAGLLTSPIGLKPAVDAIRTMTKAELQEQPDACMLRGDAMFAGPVRLWTC
ncbi:hypothetical protein [Bradyrhizobium sp. HKCCYLR20261]|uniref:hypothetical protein n=1 Tax=Bradyrhizobium sp. HKCCYLR20261 TaxID=3420760 RepID=UPI003EBDD68C